MQDNGFFDAEVARTYDRDHGGTDPAVIAQTAYVLAGLAGGGPVLEFAIGTGRIALPLMARGVVVKGIDVSRPMVAELRKKPGGKRVEVVVGDMTTTRMPGAFSLVYLVFNTIDNLIAQAAQVACFRNAAAHLAPGGRFVIETLLPRIQRLPHGEVAHAIAWSPGHWGTDVFDPVTQTYTSHHIRIRDGAVTRLSIPFRYVWPAELDLMAQLAGLVPEHRWQDWQRTTLTRHSDGHVSVWRKPLAQGDHTALLP